MLLALGQILLPTEQIHDQPRTAKIQDHFKTTDIHFGKENFHRVEKFPITVELESGIASLATVPNFGWGLRLDVHVLFFFLTFLIFGLFYSQQWAPVAHSVHSSISTLFMHARIRIESPNMLGKKVILAFATQRAQQRNARLRHVTDNTVEDPLTVRFVALDGVGIGTWERPMLDRCVGI